MRYPKLIQICFVFLVCVSHLVWSQKPGVAYIGYGSAEADKTYLIIAQDQTTRNDDAVQFHLRKEKGFKELPVEQFRSVTIYHKDIGYPLYLFAGDSIVVDSNEEGCIFKGNRKDEWNLSRTVINKSYPFLGISYWEFGSVPYEELLAAGKAKLASFIKEIDRANDSLQLSPQFVKLIKRDGTCAFIRSFIWEHKKYNKRDALAQQKVHEFVKGYEDFFAKDTLRNSFVFTYSLMSWSEFMARAENGFKQPEKTKTYVAFLGRDLGENDLQRLDMAKKMPAANRDDMMYALMSLRFATASWKGREYEPYVAYFQSVCANKAMVDHILARSGLYFLPPDQAVLASLGADKDVLTTELNAPSENKVSWEKLHSSLKGKPTYVSFWASWCGPCIQELRETKAIVEELGKTGKVNFLAISIDEDKEKWVKSIKAMGMQNSHLNYQMKLKSGLGKLLLSDGVVPKYMVIDANGTVKTMEASKLSNEGGLSAVRNLITRP